MEEQAHYNVAGRGLSCQERAILHLLSHPLYARLLKPICKPRNGAVTQGITDVFFSRLEYGVLSGGEQGAISWAYALWNDEVNPAYRDPFECFAALDLKLQQLLLEAMVIRHNTNRQPTHFERWAEQMEEP